MIYVAPSTHCGNKTGGAFTSLMTPPWFSCERMTPRLALGTTGSLVSFIASAFSKLVSKGLALRLAPFMDALVRANQMALIKGRRIHDNFRSVQLYCRWLHARQYACILLKVDIVKAFDSVAWPFLLEVLERMVFPQSWRDWIAAMLSCEHKGAGQWSRLGRRICHARGLRQGDPLSPLLFVIVMEVLNAMIVEADRRGMLTPLPGDHFGQGCCGTRTIWFSSSCPNRKTSE